LGYIERRFKPSILSPFVIFYIYNNISVHTIMAEFKKMMEES